MDDLSEGAAPGSSRTPTPNHESDIYVPITDGDADIASTLSGERMRVQAPGRLLMQTVYLWKGNRNGKKTNKGTGLTNRPYNAEEDGPATNPVERLPTAQELQSGDDVMLYREVGIVIGDDPHKYKGAPLAVKKNRIDRKRRGDMPRDESSIRAFIPFTQDIVLQSRYCVGVKPTDGYLHPRVIDSDCIFFYPEFWEGCNETNKKDRRVFMNTRMKQLTTIAQTAIVQTSSEPTRAPGAVDGLTESTTSNPSAVTQADGLVNKHILQYTLFDDPGRHGITRRMLEGIDTTAPDRDHGTTNGIKRFLDFDVDLSEQDAEHVKRELKVRRTRHPIATVTDRNQADTL